jgi:pyridoxine/pyridoxamine 5'-phosphate oxidase
MNRAELLIFLRRHRLCVQASVSPAGAPQAAVVGYGVSDALELVFDTLETTRKVQNLRRSPRIALVVGWDGEETVQIEGVADEPQGADRERLQRVYFQAYPDGQSRQAWKGITYVRVSPTWARYSDFRGTRPEIVEFSEADLRAGSSP